MLLPGAHPCNEKSIEVTSKAWEFINTCVLKEQYYNGKYYWEEYRKTSLKNKEYAVILREGICVCGGGGGGGGGEGRQLYLNNNEI